MKPYWLAALAAGMLAAGPAAALEIRVDPAPLYVFDTAPDRNIYDVLVQNILVVNTEDSTEEVRGLRVELYAGDELLSVTRMPADKIAARAGRMAGMKEAGLLDMMDFQFHLSRLLGETERLSSDATLEKGEALLNVWLYASSTGLPDHARVIAEGLDGDIGSVDVPVLRRESQVTYRAPVDGRWFVFSSGDAGHHHRWVVSSEYAIDIARLGPDMKSHTNDGTKFTDYPTFGATIMAAADGVVVAARGDRMDDESVLRQPGESFEAYEERAAEVQQGIMLQDGFEGAAGNYVLIRHANGEHSLYAHLRHGSVTVKPGDEVKAGAPIAQAGSSGNSTEPHLHFQVIDGPDLNSARGLPVIFTGLREDWMSMKGRQLRAGDVLEQEPAVP